MTRHAYQLLDGKTVIVVSDWDGLTVTYDGRVYPLRSVDEHTDHPHGLMNLLATQEIGCRVYHLVPFDARARGIYNEYRKQR